MRLRFVLVGTLATLLGAVGSTHAQTATQVVRIQVNAINQLAVTGNPAPMVINTATPGGAPTPVTVSGTSYAITTNESNQKISASVDRVLPAGVLLEVTLEAPSGAFSAGAVALNTSSADVVTGISGISAASLPITYRLSATADAQMNAPQTRTVTFTIVSGT